MDSTKFNSIEEAKDCIKAIRFLLGLVLKRLDEIQAKEEKKPLKNGRSLNDGNIKGDISNESLQRMPDMRRGAGPGREVRM